MHNFLELHCFLALPILTKYSLPNILISYPFNIHSGCYLCQQRSSLFFSAGACPCQPLPMLNPNMMDGVESRVEVDGACADPNHQLVLVLEQ